MSEENIFLRVRELRKAFGKEHILKELSLDLKAGDTLSILGRSGCGKTTFLKILAGLESMQQGQIFLDGQDISQRSPQNRNIVYLYQEPLLFPHMNVWENIAFGLRIKNAPSAQITERVESLINNLGLTRHATKRPDQLSGGQKQRVAFGRAIIINPSLLLLDEPFASLDVETRSAMQQLFKNLAKKYTITSIFVTHDLKEALLMGDRIAYMQQGSLTTYESRNDFINDPGIGVLDEIAFWTGLTQSKLTDPDKD